MSKRDRGPDENLPLPDPALRAQIYGLQSAAHGEALPNGIPLGTPSAVRGELAARLREERAE